MFLSKYSFFILIHKLSQIAFFHCAGQEFANFVQSPMIDDDAPRFPLRSVILQERNNQM